MGPGHVGAAHNFSYSVSAHLATGWWWCSPVPPTVRDVTSPQVRRGLVPLNTRARVKFGGLRLHGE